MKMLKQLLYVAKILRERGITFFWTYFIESLWFDLRHGTRTSARVPKDEQTIDSSSAETSNGLLYVASFTSVTRVTVEHARKILGNEFFARSQFVDLGCGKGKALLVFSKLFGGMQKLQALGIEYDSRLVSLAKENISKCDFAINKVSVLTDSAVNVLDHVSSSTLIIYLYNSFQGKTLKLVLETLSHTPHVLIYVDPAEKDILREYGYVIKVENKGRYNADTWLVASLGLDRSLE